MLPTILCISQLEYKNTCHIAPYSRAKSTQGQRYLLARVPTCYLTFPSPLRTVSRIHSIPEDSSAPKGPRPDVQPPSWNKPI